MGLTFELDLSGYTDRDQIEAGDSVPVGWYRTSLDEHYEDANKEGQFVFVFKALGGLYDGKKLFYRLQHPGYIDDQKKAQYARSRIGMLASRLGLIGDDDLGKSNMGVDFDKAIGQEVVVRVVEQKGREEGARAFIGIGYADVYPPDHPKIPKDVRALLQLPPARESAGKGTTKTALPTGAGAKKDDFADL